MKRRTLFYVGAAALASYSSPANGATQIRLSRREVFDLMIQTPPSTPRALQLQFTFPDNVVWDGPPGIRHRENSLFGIDVSHFDGDIDWTRVQSMGVQFAYLKATQGTSYVDSFYRRNRRSIEALPVSGRIYQGAYHFLSSDKTGNAQATHYIQTTQPQQSPDTMPPCLDLEWDVRTDNRGKIINRPDGKPRDFWDRRKADNILQEVRTWLDRVAQNTAKTPIVYTNKAWWRERIGDEALISVLSPSTIWIADYAADHLRPEKPAVPGNAHWSLWQFTSAARLAASLPTMDHLDASLYKGSLAEFRTTFGIS